MIKKVLNNSIFYVILDFSILILFYFMFNEDNFKYVFLVIILVNLILKIRLLFHFLMNNKYLFNQLSNNRILKVSGLQGAGKTNHMLQIASLFKADNIYSLTPFSVNGEKVKVLTYEHLTMKKKIKEGSLLVLDEISLLFNALSAKGKAKKDELEKVELFLQLFRHLFNGYVVVASVDNGRIEKRLRDKMGNEIYMIDTKFSRFSFTNLIINKYFYKNRCCIKKKIEFLDMKKIDNESYYFDLANLEKKNKFTSMNKLYFNASNIKFDYDDRYFKKLYQILEANEQENFYKNMELTKEELIKNYPYIAEILEVKL